MSAPEPLAIGNDLYPASAAPIESDTEDAWSLDERLGVIITAPPGLYEERYGSDDSRWVELAKDFNIELSRLFLHTFPDAEVSPLRQPYRRRLPMSQGGMFPELSELQLIAKDVNAVVQGLAGWIALADIARRLAPLWGEVVLQRREQGTNALPLEPPILGLPWIKALCIADLEQKYNITDVPALAVGTRSTPAGDVRHPVGDERHIVAAKLGTQIVQTIVYIVTSHGELQEKFCITQNDAFTVDILNASWIGGRNHFVESTAAE